MARASLIPVVEARGLWQDSKRVHVVGRLVVVPGSYETEVSVGDLLLVSGEFRDITAIATDLSLTVGAAYSNLANDTAPKIIRGTPRPLTGSINVTASASVVGVGTKFLTELSVGDYLMIGTATAGEVRRIIAVLTNLTLTVDSAFTDLADDAAPLFFKAEDLDQIRGSIDPAASTTVTGVNTKFLGQGIRFNLAQDGPRKLSFQAPPLEVRVWGRSGFVYQYTNREFYQRLSGTIDTAASATVPGVSTKFTTELAVGDRYIAGIEERTVRSIASDTSLIATLAHTDQANDTFPKKIIQSPTLKDGQLRIFGLFTVGGAAAAGTGALHLVSGVLSKEEAANEVAWLPEHFTAAVDNRVVQDVIQFHAIFQPNL